MGEDQENTVCAKVIVVLGRTASGKSALAVELAQRLGSSVISVDSLQVYRNFGVVSDKIVDSEMKGVPHFGLDLLEPSDELNVSWFIDYAVTIVVNELAAGRSPIIVGGTNMYIEKLLFTSQLDAQPDESSHSQSNESRVYTHQHLEEIDPGMAKRLHENDTRRVSRAIDYYYDTGKRLSDSLSEQKREVRWPNTVVLVKHASENENLDERIKDRIHSKMIASGGLLRELNSIESLLAEYKLIWNKGLLQAIGYREFEEFVTKRITTGISDQSLFDKAVEEMIRNTVRYSKKQQKWINKMETFIDLIHVDSCSDDLIRTINMHRTLKVKSLPKW
jgi:tRNA dimethylallyltransferase